MTTRITPLLLGVRCRVSETVSKSKLRRLDQPTAGTERSYFRPQLCRRAAACDYVRSPADILLARMHVPYSDVTQHRGVGLRRAIYQHTPCIRFSRRINLTASGSAFLIRMATEPLIRLLDWEAYGHHISEHRRSQDLVLGWHWGSSLPFLSPPLPVSLPLPFPIESNHRENFWNPRCLWVLEHFGH